MGDLVEELLGFGFVSGGAAVVVLEVAEGGLGVGLGADEKVALSGRGFLPLGGVGIHVGHVAAHRSGMVAVAGLLEELRGFLVVFPGAICLADFIVEIAQLIVDGPRSAMAEAG